MVNAVGMVLTAIGAILVLIGFIWVGLVGFYMNDLPVIIMLFLIAAAFLWAGSKVPSSEPAAKPNAPVGASTHWLAPSNTASTTTDWDADLGPDTSPVRLAELAATKPRLWPQIELHPNAYPALVDWINSERSSQRPEESGCGSASERPRYSSGRIGAAG